MSDEKIKKIVAEPPAQPNVSSIMSAPRDKKKAQSFFIVVVALVVSLILNVVLAIVSLSKNEHISQMEKDITDYKADIIELKNKINALDTAY